MIRKHDYEVPLGDHPPKLKLKIPKTGRQVVPKVGQKRPRGYVPLAIGPAQQQGLLIPPEDVKFPVVTHKEIQVEIVPSDDANLTKNIDRYEIEFTGRKTSNKYNVNANIKNVKLVRLQSDTEYLINVCAIRGDGECRATIWKL